LFLFGLFVSLCFGLPLFYMVATSFKPAVEIYHLPPTFFPSQPTLAGYRELVSLSNVAVAFYNSSIVSTLASAVGVALSTGLCYAISRFRLPGVRFLTYLMLFIYVLPATLVMLPMYTLFARLGLQSGLLPITVVDLSGTLPFGILLLRSYFAGIPLDLEDAAVVDGATRVQAFLHVVLPLARPGIIATFIFNFILCWNEVLYASIFATTPHNMLLSTALSMFLQETGWYSWGMINAAGVVATVPVLVFFILIQRQLVTGLTAGAIKG
jgi:ABC-type glycerol-3-phosphate transport system permease component